MHNFIVSRICLVSILLLIQSYAYSQWQKLEYSTMGTNIVLEVFHENIAVSREAINAVQVEMERINRSMSTYISDSEISILNANAFTRKVVVSKELYELISLSKEMSKLTKGAFDITYASVGYLYSYPEKKRPSEAKINTLLPAVNYTLIELNPEELSIGFLHKDLKIDLGGIAKGHAVDKAIEIINTYGIEHALVTAGGDTRLLGDRLGKPWIVGIRDPRDKSKQAVVIPLQNSAMSTSGDYERYFEEDGVRFHHILSPKTGKSTYEVQSVSIIGPLSVYNDALSTAVFVMGLEKGIGMINSLPEFEAIVMDAKRRMHYSNGLLSERD